MDIIYVDESGDPGGLNSPTKEYILVAMIVPGAIWHQLDGRINRLRLRMQKHLGVKPDEEIHAVEFLGGARMHQGLMTWERIKATRWLLKEIRRQSGLRFIMVVQSKDSTLSPFSEAWVNLAGRLERELSGKGLIITDATDRKSLQKALGYKWVRDESTAATPTHSWHAKLVENPIHVDSRHSRLLQITDLIAYLCRQGIRPNSLFTETKPRQLVRMVKKMLN